MACVGCQQRRQAIGRAVTAVRTGDTKTVKRETVTMAKSALADLMRLARRREKSRS